MARMWMVRGESGRWYDTFRERGIAAIGWSCLAEHARPGVSRQQLMALYREQAPQAKAGAIVAGASQVWRFVNDIQIGDWIITYSPANRLYSIGAVTSPANHHPHWATEGLSLARQVAWQTPELPRDSLSVTAKNTLGATLTLFEAPAHVATEILTALQGQPSVDASVTEDGEEAADPLADIELQALERIKDTVSALSWDDMQQLVAGILRAMGYKTQVSPPGADRGKDIVASPDGFGFEHPRIVVEVKHRNGQMGSQDIRSFLGGRHKDDRGLYVSTGGFSKDAQYEADRAAIPLALWTLDHLVRALIEHYDAADAQTKQLAPLKRLYWPV